MMRFVCATLGIALWTAPAAEPSVPVSHGTRARVRTLRVTVLSTMLADRGIGEWGFAALVEADGRRILFDTGARPETVLRNAEELGIDLASVEEVILSHSHGDHTGGLVTLRRELMKRNPRALSRAHVARGIFLRRTQADGSEANGLLPDSAAYVALGGAFIEHAGPVEIFPGVWLTGPVPRRYPERNWGRGVRLATTGGAVEDTVPEDQSLVLATARGLVVISGCGHAGIVNTVEYAREIVAREPIHAAIGGLHLLTADDATLAWTGARLKGLQLQHLLGAHCTGIEAVFRLRELAGLDRRRAVVGAVGSSFTLGAGIDPLALAR
jgi:7,8-dihydropterin-6-yl-methyl-4-(beta-D-ribofuranosyl)aminobenzene 5'-phosphate synthase